MKKLLNILLLISFTQVVKAQIDIENVSKILIIDEININFDKINSYYFEIRFNDSIELWDTKQISRAEFKQEIFKQQTDSIYLDICEKRNKIEDEDSIKLLFKNARLFLDSAYINYCDTVKAEFIKYIPKKIIVELLRGVQDSVYSEDMLTTQNKLSDTICYGNSILITSYYPLMALIISSIAGDTLVVFNDGQQDLLLPWYNRNMDKEIWNPIINLSLDAILSDERNYNKKRLTNGIKQ